MVPFQCHGMVPCLCSVREKRGTEWFRACVRFGKYRGTEWQDFGSAHLFHAYGEHTTPMKQCSNKNFGSTLFVF
jgi:hypothetical protein